MNNLIINKNLFYHSNKQYMYDIIKSYSVFVLTALAMILTQCLIISMGYLWLSYATIAILLLMEYLQQDTSIVIYNKTWWLECIIFTSYAVSIFIHTFL